MPPPLPLHTVSVPFPAACRRQNPRCRGVVGIALPPGGSAVRHPPVAPLVSLRGVVPAFSQLSRRTSFVHGAGVTLLDLLGCRRLWRSGHLLVVFGSACLRCTRTCMRADRRPPADGRLEGCIAPAWRNVIGCRCSQRAPTPSYVCHCASLRKQRSSRSFRLTLSCHRVSQYALGETSSALRRSPLRAYHSSGNRHSSFPRFLPPRVLAERQRKHPRFSRGPLDTDTTSSQSVQCISKAAADAGRTCRCALGVRSPPRDVSRAAAHLRAIYQRIRELGRSFFACGHACSDSGGSERCRA